jgi:hypothetical protein
MCGEPIGVRPFLDGTLKTPSNYADTLFVRLPLDRAWGPTVLDLAPDIHRQRLVVEGLVTSPISAEDIVCYLKDVGRLTGMRVLTEPVTHRSPLYGWAGWVHWETSGAHFYAWDTPRRFFSVDIYTCKAFDADEVADFTSRYFRATEMVSRAF